ncbi:MAG: hypothetical protein WD120_03135, partial [Gemmatimonadota bacterium]
PGLQAPGAARPGWMPLHLLVAELSGGEDESVPGTAAEAFLFASSFVAEWSGLSYADIGTRGALINEPVALPGS